MTNAEARFNKSLRPRKPEGSLGRTAQDVHLDSHTAPELCERRRKQAPKVRANEITHHADNVTGKQRSSSAEPAATLRPLPFKIVLGLKGRNPRVSNCIALLVVLYCRLSWQLGYSQSSKSVGRQHCSRKGSGGNSVLKISQTH